MTLFDSSLKQFEVYPGMRIGLRCALAMLWLAPGVLPAAETSTIQVERIEVEPATMQLRGPRAEMGLVVTGIYADGTSVDLTSEVDVRSTNDEIVSFSDGRSRPMADGRAELAVRACGLEVRVPVEVTFQDQVHPISFQTEALAVLTKHGCNSGGCHGAPSGKGGFRLSLFAYDAELDQLTLTREYMSRRSNLFDPSASLLLSKPTMKVPHGGGLQLKTSDPGYRILRDWVAQGCQVSEETAACQRIEIHPGDRVLHLPDARQQLLAIGYFDDGSVRDVTHLATFFSADETLVQINEKGHCVGTGHGETAVVVRYLDQVAAVRLTCLQDNGVEEWSPPEISNYIDKLVFAKLRQMRYHPSEVCSDSQFVRRTFLDVLGVLPTADEARSFEEDASPGKRGRLIDHLLERPEFAAFWATKWGDLFRIKHDTLSRHAVHKFHRWLVRAIETNMPYDQFVYELVTAAGDTVENPPANYFRAAADTDDCIQTTTQTFMGVRMRCAKCHNHPYERWTQDNYYGLGAFFHRLNRTATSNGSTAVWFDAKGDIQQPRTGEAMRPWLPTLGVVAATDDQDWREMMADWLVSPDNPYLARVEVNRIWSHLFGIGVVEPIDDFRDSNPPAHPDLLDAMSQDFVDHDFDRKHIVRTILNSATYQLDSKSNAANQADSRYFSHYPTRRLSAEQLLDAISRVTNVRDTYNGLPDGTLATQLPSPDAGMQFLQVFGKPQRNTACECERVKSSDLAQVLELTNGAVLDQKLRNEENRFRQAISQGQSDAEILDAAFWCAYSRQPTLDERQDVLQLLASDTDRVTVWEDIFWSLLNRKEFLFQH